MQILSFVKVVDELETHLDCWLYFLKHAGELEAMPTVFKDDVVERAFTIAELSALSPEDRQRDDEELQHDRDALNRLDTAWEEGIEQGRQEGLQEAINLYDFIHNALRERAARQGFPFIWKYPETLSGV